MAMSLMRGTSPSDIWDYLEALILTPGSIGLSLKNSLNKLNFYDEFNRTAVDATVWTSGGDAGSFELIAGNDLPTIWALITGNVTDNDRYIHGEGLTENKHFTPFEVGYTTVTWKARIAFSSVASISALFGLVSGAIVDYAEPAGDCAHFLADPAITNTFRARSWNAAEEETDTLVALDTALHRFRIEWTGPSILFYIDDVLVATHDTQVPDIRMTSELLIRTEANAEKRLLMDYVHVELS